MVQDCSMRGKVSAYTQGKDRACRRGKVPACMQGRVPACTQGQIPAYMQGKLPACMRPPGRAVQRALSRGARSATAWAHFQHVWHMQRNSGTRRRRVRSYMRAHAGQFWKKVATGLPAAAMGLWSAASPGRWRQRPLGRRGAGRPCEALTAVISGAAADGALHPRTRAVLGGWGTTPPLHAKPRAPSARCRQEIGALVKCDEGHTRKRGECGVCLPCSIAFRVAKRGNGLRSSLPDKKVPQFRCLRRMIDVELPDRYKLATACIAVWQLFLLDLVVRVLDLQWIAHVLRIQQDGLARRSLVAHMSNQSKQSKAVPMNGHGQA
eukprot:365263-Chlamydomonas_euryale.AAC.9